MHLASFLDLQSTYHLSLGCHLVVDGRRILRTGLSLGLSWNHHLGLWLSFDRLVVLASLCLVLSFKSQKNLHSSINLILWAWGHNQESLSLAEVVQADKCARASPKTLFFKP